MTQPWPHDDPEELQRLADVLQHPAAEFWGLWAALDSVRKEVPDLRKFVNDYITAIDLHDFGMLDPYLPPCEDEG